MHHLPPSVQGRICPCGARVEPGTRRCLKCRFRSRWIRHKRRHDGI